MRGVNNSPHPTSCACQPCGELRAAKLLVEILRAQKLKLIEKLNDAEGLLRELGGKDESDANGN